jgi:hypothetical protein
VGFYEICSTQRCDRHACFGNRTVSLLLLSYNPSYKNQPLSTCSNYRGNVFGFLCGPDVPPKDINASILDHFFTMDFVFNNAAGLEGIKNKITVWGQSYGATMLEMEMLYLKKQDVKASTGILDSRTGPI